MNIISIIYLILAVLPIYLISLYIYKKDYDKESRALLTKLFVSGIFSCVPIIVLELVIGSFFGESYNMSSLRLFSYVFFSIAVIEEGCKCFFTYKIAYNNAEFDHIYDAVVYCVFLTLGFALVENIFYIFDGGIGTGLLRAISAVPAHACFAVVMGNFLGMAKIASVNHNKVLEKRYLFFSMIIPSVVHCIYDFCIYADSVGYILLFFGIVIFIYVYSIKKIKELANIKDSFNTDNHL